MLGRSHKNWKLGWSLILCLAEELFRWVLNGYARAQAEPWYIQSILAPIPASHLPPIHTVGNTFLYSTLKPPSAAYSYRLWYISSVHSRSPTIRLSYSLWYMSLLLSRLVVSHLLQHWRRSYSNFILLFSKLCWRLTKHGLRRARSAKMTNILLMLVPLQFPNPYSVAQASQN